MGKGFAAAVVSLLVAVGACGSTSRSPPSDSGTSPSDVSPRTSPTTPAGMTFGPATAPVDPIGSHVVAIGGRFFGDDEHGQDQLWWNFTGGAPGCTAEYVAPPITDEQTGEVVEIAGSSFVRMRCSPVRALDLGRENREGQIPHTYDETVRYRRGSDTDFPPARNMVEVVQTGWGGGVLTITVGLRHRVPMGVAWVGGSDPGATGPSDVQGAWLVVMQ